jgi:hypothetical protein
MIKWTCFYHNQFVVWITWTVCIHFTEMTKLLLCTMTDSVTVHKLYSVSAHCQNDLISSSQSPSESRDSSVGIVPGYGLDDRGSRVQFPAGAGNFSLHHRVQNCSGAHQLPIQQVPGSLSLGVKRPGREADHSPPSSAEVKERVELYLHSSNTPSWHGAQLKHKVHPVHKITFVQGHDCNINMTVITYISEKLVRSETV